jgi:hypothetical protein
MKRRWLLLVAIAVAVFGLIMQAAHIGPIGLWIIVTVAALGLFYTAGKSSTAGRR